MKLLKGKYFYLLFISSFFFLGTPGKFPADDGFFYPQIAYNIVHHGFIGFNDLYITNGFHPLWMVFCTVAELLNPFDKTFVLYIIWFFQVFIVFSGFVLLEKTIFKDSKIGKILSLGFYCLMFFSLGTLYLTEAHLAFFTITLLVFFMFKKLKNDFLFGVICSLVFLARLDHIFIILPFGFLYWSYRAYDIKSLFRSLIGFSILSLPYLLSNFYFFGYLVPVSGRIKSSFPYLQNDIVFEILPKVFTFFGISYFLFLICNKKVPDRTIKFLFLMGSLIHLFYNLLFQSAIGQWYFVSQIMFCGFFVYDLVRQLDFKIFQSNIFNKTIFTVVLIFLCSIGYLKLTTSFSIQNNIIANHSKFEKKPKDLIKQTVQEFKKDLPENARIYVYDFPGKFAFYSNYNIIPADGLVANIHFFNEMKDGNFKTFLITNKIEYLLFPTHFLNKSKEQGFFGLTINNMNDENVIYVKNSIRKSVIDSVNEKDLKKIKSYSNPLKTWQPQYDSITIYKLKE